MDGRLWPIASNRLIRGFVSNLGQSGLKADIGETTRLTPTLNSWGQHSRDQKPDGDDLASSALAINFVMATDLMDRCNNTTRANRSYGSGMGLSLTVRKSLRSARTNRLMAPVLVTNGSWSESRSR
jgi:hypothetical protein